MALMKDHTRINKYDLNNYDYYIKVSSEKNRHEQMGNFSREVETINKKKHLMEMPEIKSTVTE